MTSKKPDENLWLGREFEENEGPISELRLKIPTFTSSPFRIGAGVNEYLNLIAREPLGEVGVGDEVNPENSIRIPVAAVSNSNYKLVQHYEVLDNVLNALRGVSESRRTNAVPEESTLMLLGGLFGTRKKETTDLESLRANLRLSKYGERMWMSFLVPDYKFDTGYGHSVTLRVECLNSVDRSIAVRIRLFLSRKDFEFNTFVARLIRNHDPSLEDGEIEEFLKEELSQLSTKKCFNTSVSDDKVDNWIQTTVAEKWGKNATARAYQLIKELEGKAAENRKSTDELGSRFSNEPGEKNAFLLRHVLSLIAQERKTLVVQEVRLGQISKMMDELLEEK